MNVEIEPDKTNPFEPTTEGDDGDELIPMTSTSSRRGSEDTTNPYHDKTHEETSFIEGIDEDTPLIRKERELDESVDGIKKRYPNADTSKFFSKMDEHDRLIVRLSRKNGKWRLLYAANGELANNTPPDIVKALGKPAEEIVVTNEAGISTLTAKQDELRIQRETASENQRETIDHQINDLENEIDGLERENKVIEQRISLRDRVKTIFKKYGFTLVAVLTAVGTVIGVIVSNLKNGLTTLGKGVGDGLKTIGKKLGEILPGLVGAIASFIFKTAGEVIGFLGKNAWLLIMAVVVYFIEQFKKRR